MMFDDEEAVTCKQFVGMGPYRIENFDIVGNVRRIEEDYVPGLYSKTNDAIQKLSSFRLDNLRLLFWNSAEVHVCLHQTTHFSRTINECDVTGASRQGFYSDSSRTGAEIQKSRALDSRCYHIKEGLAQAVGGRPHLKRWWAF
jgi:hypothetical protein